MANITRFNLSELESEGMVSVYLNGKFAWQLPKKLLSLRVPKAVEEKDVDGEEIIHSGTYRWEIGNFSQDAFRLFAEWLYNARGQLKELAQGASIKPYLELATFANRYEIDALIPVVNTIVQQSFDNPETMSGMGESYDALEAKSPDRASISARFAALVVGKKMDIPTLKPLIKSADLARDMLLWVTLYHQEGSGHQEVDEILLWMGQNCQRWIETLE
ncbi:Hypothetical protein PENO1_061480 [Penicillium occitanis (nom. inval.)]|nr:Hypothetical protein PENO1_061480 [Penicillium occitanis (nom. inval.)]PCH08211.1 hypothetical protein PENOC_015800 [Penicillium occitanis (nom. inval.)]